jgi:hypothetical protein
MSVPTIDRRILLPLASLLASVTERAQWTSLVAIVLFLLSVGGVMHLIGLPVISALPWDMSIQLDGAWRIVHGQIPNVDFRAVIPPATLELSALGILLGSSSAACITTGNLLLFLALTPYAWVTARRRFSAAYACLFAMFVGLMVLAPRPLGDKIAAASYAMLYNRQGYALLSVIVVSILVPLLPGVVKRPALGGLGVGVLLALLAFSKLTFFAVAVAAIGLHVLFDRRAWVWVMPAVLIGFIGTVVLLHAITGLDFVAYLRETEAIGRVYVQGKWKDVIEVAFKNLDQLFVVAALALLCAREPNGNRQTSQAWGKGTLLFSIVFLCASALVLTATSAQRFELPLCVVAGLMCIEWLRRGDTDRTDASVSTRTGYVFGAIILAPLLFGPLIGKDAGALLRAVRSNVGGNAQSVRVVEGFNSEALRDFLILNDRTVVSELTPSQPASVYPGQVNDGIELLRQHVGRDSRVIALDFSNPFPFALQLPPARGGSTSWLLNGSFSKRDYPAPTVVFGDADLVMIPSYERNGSTVAALKDIYGTYLERNFRRIGQTGIWMLYERREAR